MKKTLHKFTCQLKCWICTLTLFSSFSVFAQSSQMRGSVQDGKGQPLIGVSIFLKEASNTETRGTTSDIDGNYFVNN